MFFFILFKYKILNIKILTFFWSTLTVFWINSCFSSSYMPNTNSAVCPTFFTCVWCFSSQSTFQWKCIARFHSVSIKDHSSSFLANFSEKLTFLTPWYETSQERRNVSFSGNLTNVLNPAGIYLLKVNNRNTRTRWKICSKLTIKIRSGIFIVNFEHISHLALVFLLLTQSR